MTTTDQNEDRFLKSGDEAGTPPGDRSFRPDIQGLRALAIGLVVLYHAGVPGISGGYVGVDVFFVISGYVITGLLLRERARSDKTSLLHFYGRRARRILPASTIVIVLTVIAAFHFLGFLSGGEVASDAQSAALFVANFHFISLGTNYASAQSPPSPLQNFWSLAVEEQFYFVYPTLFLLTAILVRRVSLAAKLIAVLVLITVASYVWCILQTHSNATAAYFSPFTRAWELSLGSLVAIVAPCSRRLPSARIAAILTWVGLLAIIVSAFAFDKSTSFPGAIDMLPVGGTALLIWAGTQAPRFAAEDLLKLPPLQWLGLISYSLYLIHWPVLTIYTEDRSIPPSLGIKLLLVVASVVLSIVCYLAVENPLRHSKRLRARPFLSVALVPLCIGISLGTIAVARNANGLPAFSINHGHPDTPLSAQSAMNRKDEGHST